MCLHLTGSLARAGMFWMAILTYPVPSWPGVGVRVRRQVGLFLQQDSGTSYLGDSGYRRQRTEWKLTGL